MLTGLLATVAIMTETTPPPEGPEVDPSTVSPGLVGFLIFLFLAVATFLLWRSMNRQLKKIDFDEDSGTPPDGK